jgi:hypothetical protein
MEAEGRTDLLAEIINNAERFFSKDLRPRRGMWQLMLGGVFDRHPNLKLLMTEVRGTGCRQRCDTSMPSSRSTAPICRPCASPASTGVSTASRRCRSCTRPRWPCAMTSGIETITFGRDYPHAEGTWPNTADWLSDAFAGVPDDELRLMLGENAIRVLGLDRATLAVVAERIGPRVADITGRTPELSEPLLANWDARGGYLKPPEPHDPAGIDELLSDDIAVAAHR